MDKSIYLIVHRLHEKLFSFAISTAMLSLVRMDFHLIKNRQKFFIHWHTSMVKWNYQDCIKLFALLISVIGRTAKFQVTFHSGSKLILFFEGKFTCIFGMEESVHASDLTWMPGISNFFSLTIIETFHSTYMHIIERNMNYYL